MEKNKNQLQIIKEVLNVELIQNFNIKAFQTFFFLIIGLS